jgi:predicted CxxxxCH...CXXCH cytochrome family protein
MKKDFIILVLLIFGIYACSELDDKSPVKSKVITEVDTHGKGWTDTTSQNFHGKVLKSVSWSKYELLNIKNNGVEDCRKCHGQDLKGGTSGVSCYKCHSAYPHATNWTSASDTTDFHGKFVRKAYNWDYTKCGACHGTNLKGGGNGEVSCFKCHQSAQTDLLSCNTCHGRFISSSSDTAGFAPPTDLNGNSSTSYVGVGAHQSHLTAKNSLAGKLNCVSCHGSMPNTIKDATHINGAVNTSFGDLAKTVTNEATTSDYDKELSTITPNPSFNGTSCANSYCHGNFKNGNNYSPSWTQIDKGEAKCGTCHGDASTENPLPKTSSQGGTHPNVTSCNTCHSQVVDTDNKTIKDASKHINGKLNIFSEERDF